MVEVTSYVAYIANPTIEGKKPCWNNRYLQKCLGEDVEMICLGTPLNKKGWKYMVRAKTLLELQEALAKFD